MPNSDRLQFPLLQFSDTAKYNTVNLSLEILDSILFSKIAPDLITVVPGSPTDGTIYLIATGGSGILAGNGGRILYYTSNGTVPNIGIVESGVVIGNYVSTGTNWVNNVLKNDAITLYTVTASVAIPNTPFQHYRILVAPGATITLTSALVLVGTSLILIPGYYEVITDGTNIYVK